jgi:hypothetical protein
MKLAFVAVVIAIIGFLIYADRKWRQWIAAQKRERDRDRNNF